MNAFQALVTGGTNATAAVGALVWAAGSYLAQYAWSMVASSPTKATSGPKGAYVVVPLVHALAARVREHTASELDDDALLMAGDDAYRLMQQVRCWGATDARRSHRRHPDSRRHRGLRGACVAAAPRGPPVRR